MTGYTWGGGAKRDPDDQDPRGRHPLCYTSRDGRAMQRTLDYHLILTENNGRKLATIIQLRITPVPIRFVPLFQTPYQWIPELRMTVVWPEHYGLEEYLDEDGNFDEEDDVIEFDEDGLPQDFDSRSDERKPGLTPRFHSYLAHPHRATQDYDGKLCVLRYEENPSKNSAPMYVEALRDRTYDIQPSDVVGQIDGKEVTGAEIVSAWLFGGQRSQWEMEAGCVYLGTWERRT